MPAGGHFGCPKFTFDRISGHFRSIGHFGFPKYTFSIAILAISDRYRILFSGGHFGCLKITLDRISGHFRLIGHFGCPKCTFDSISGHFSSYRTFFLNFWQNGGWRPFWMSANNFRSHFWPFQIDTQLFFFNFWTKWPPAAILDGTTMSIIERVRDIWMSNACVKFEERSLNPSKVIAVTRLCGGGGGGGGGGGSGGRPRGGCVADENLIFPKTYVSREYNESIYFS